MSRKSRQDAPNGGTLTPRVRLFLESLPPERYPRLVEAATPLSEGVDPDTYFAFGLDLLLAGIEAMAVRKRQGLDLLLSE
jgi:hypothetical protein